MEPNEPAPATLYVCGTPLGNLGDASPRLREVLGEVDAIACEDTRRCRQLLSALEVPAPRLLSYRADNEAGAAAGIVQLLERGDSVALVTDAGMPGISDPGSHLVRAAHAAGIAVRVVPGPSAVASALALSGMSGSGYRFVGFLPRKQSQLRDLLHHTASDVVVAFESPRRLAVSLREVAEVQPERSVAVCRELTKQFERVISGSATSVAAQLIGDDERGETVIVLGALPQPEHALDERAVQLVQELAAEGLSLKRASRHVAQFTGARAGELYDAVVSRRTT